MLRSDSLRSVLACSFSVLTLWSLPACQSGTGLPGGGNGDDYLILDDEETYGNLRIVADRDDAEGARMYRLRVIETNGVQVDDMQTTPKLRFVWDFGAGFGEPVEGQEQSVTFPNYGRYLITVTAYNSTDQVVFQLTLDLNVTADGPTARAGADQNAVEGAQVCLDGSASTFAPAQAPTYQWSQLSGPSVGLSAAGAASAQVCFTAPAVAQNTQLVFLLTTGQGAAAVDDVVVVNVTPAAEETNQVVADAGPDQTVSTGDAVSLDGRNSAGSGMAALTYQWAQTSGPAVSLTGAVTAVAGFAAPVVEAPTEFVFTLTVHEGAAVAVDETVVTVNPAVGEDVIEEPVDNCPDDPAKLEPGVCGCGESDADADANGVADCLEPQSGGFGPEDFQAYACGGNPADWQDTAASNSMSPANDFSVQCLADGRAFGTTSNKTNIHSHYTGAGSDALRSYTYSGRMMIADANGGIGVTLLSDYPSSDSYYRLRRGAFSGGHAFHLDAHPDSSESFVGTTNSGVVPSPLLWYRFRLEVVDTGARTEVRARLWPDGSAEPSAWQINAYDASATRRKSGTFGVWSMGNFGKYWDDLRITTSGCDADSDGDGEPDCTDRCPADPAKTQPGACGCGVADVDSDQDGLMDCHDTCVGTGDSDGDGVPDCADGCPNDALKSAPGVCGCGVADTDSDGDGVPNCNDVCPGVPDADADGDGVPNCQDVCPGYDDAQDTDGDGIPDRCDEAQLALSTTAISLAGADTQATFEVWNAGAWVVSYTVSENANWLSVSPTSGSSGGERDTITLTASRAGLANGTYTTDVTVSASGLASQVVRVTLLVQPQTTALTPIARWDVVPRQRIGPGETLKAGVVAFSKHGIAEVQFHISGQGYSGVNPKVATQMTYNDQVDVWEYWVPISAGEFATDGMITVEAVVIGNDGGVRDKNTTPGDGLEPLKLIVNPRNTLKRHTAWVDAYVGNDDTGLVNLKQRPFKKISAALQALAAAQGGKADGGIVRLKPGDYVADGGGNYSGATVNVENEWVTITLDAAEGGTQANTRITSRDSGDLKAMWLKVEGITLSAPSIINGGSSSDGDRTKRSVWLKGCDIKGGSSDFPFPVGSGWRGPHYYTECTIRDQRRASGNGQNHKLMRNLVILNTREDCFQSVPFGVNIYVDGSDPGPGANPEHADVIQGPPALSTEGAYMHNWIWYNVVATDLHYQGIFVRSGATSRNNAFVNCLFEMRTPIRNDVSGRGTTFAGKYDHLLFWHCSFVGTGTKNKFNLGQYESTTSPTNQFLLKNVSVRGCLFERFRSGVSSADDAWMSNADVDIRDNHFITTSTAGDADMVFPNSPGGTKTTGDPQIVTDVNSDLFGMPSGAGSPLVNRISPLLVPADAYGTPHGGAADIGALAY